MTVAGGAPGTAADGYRAGEEPDPERCPLTPLGMARCDQPAFYEMDIDRNEKWIPLCVEHGPMYRRSSNVRVRTRRTNRVTAGHEDDTQEEQR